MPRALLFAHIRWAMTVDSWTAVAERPGADINGDVGASCEYPTTIEQELTMAGAVPSCVAERCSLWHDVAMRRRSGKPAPGPTRAA